MCFFMRKSYYLLVNLANLDQSSCKHLRLKKSDAIVEVGKIGDGHHCQKEEVISC